MLGSISASTIGSSIADNKETERKALEKQQTEAEPAKNTGHEVDVEAADPEAAAFVLKNQAKIQEVIEQLKAQGKL